MDALFAAGDYDNLLAGVTSTPGPRPLFFAPRQQRGQRVREPCPNVFHQQADRLDRDPLFRGHPRFRRARTTGQSGAVPHGSRRPGNSSCPTKRVLAALPGPGQTGQPGAGAAWLGYVPLRLYNDRV